jgi:phosphoribosyl 1,2-cyclic phosphodiesterase
VRFCSLGSGSTGNAWLVESGSTRLLVDCGVAPRRLVARMQAAGIEPESVSALLVTHEHEDHVGTVLPFLRRCEAKVYATWGTARASGAYLDLPAGRLAELAADEPLAIGDIGVRPVPVPHDAREPVQYVFDDGRARMAIVTDLGSGTPHLAAACQDLDALVLEANHDTDMLWRGNYPEFLKQRVGGPFGHLSNDASAAFLGQVAGPRLRHLVAAHLSIRNNTPERARAAWAAVLGARPEDIQAASDEGIGWLQVA